MVHTGATSHLPNDVTRFPGFDHTFRPEEPSAELADGTRCSGIAQKRATAEVLPIDSRGKRRKTTLGDALFIPS